MRLPVSEISSIDTDVLVLGGGLAGSQAAVAARRAGRQTTLAYRARGASSYVIAANVPLAHADDRDSPENYANDMLKGGYRLNDRRLVIALSEQSLATFNELVSIGVPFAGDGNRYLQRHLSGNTFARSVFVPEGTGRIIVDHLRKYADEIGVRSLNGHQAIALLKDGDEVVGAMLARSATGELLAVRANSVVIATGGIGKLYEDSTYPVDVSCASYGLAFDAGANLIDMEFVQFEPLVTVVPAGCRGMEMPTAMLGEGATLLNASGERFMFRYNGENAERQIEKARLSLCIQQEIDEGRGLPAGTVHMDTTILPTGSLESYVSHLKRLRASDFDPAVEMPQVRPAAHSEMGGIFIDEHGFTGVPGLYAAGEATGGVHGASRLAGNGGGETIVFGRIAGLSAAKGSLSTAPRDWHRIERNALHVLESSGNTGAPAEQIKAETRSTMARNVGIYRTRPGLSEAIETLKTLDEASISAPAADLKSAIDMLEARQMVLSARMIAAAAMERTESRGAHQRRDYPAQDDARWLKHIAFKKGSGSGFVMDHIPIA